MLAGCRATVLASAPALTSTCCSICREMHIDVLTQVPAASVVERLGAKAVLSLNNLGLALALLSLPSVARSRAVGFRGLWFSIAAIGILQGPFVSLGSFLTGPLIG
eukprot:COSAG01_NODE_3280_length_6312_cov_45.174823_2_plen_106_part_00